MQSLKPAFFPLGLNPFLDYGLDLVIRHFNIRHLNLAITLRVIESSYIMCQRIPSKQSLIRSMAKLTMSIDSKGYRGPVSAECVLFHKLDRNLVVISLNSLILNPLWQIIKNKTYIDKAKR